MLKFGLGREQTLSLLGVGATHSQLALRNNRGGIEGALRSVWKARAEQTQCRGQQESGVRGVSRSNLSDQHGLVLRQQRRSRKGL